jgi:hypothetical protein
MEINFWSIVTCALASMVTGFIWYGPLFSKVWSREMGWGEMTPEKTKEMQKMAKPAYLQQFVGSLLMAFIFALVLNNFDSTRLGMALAVAIMIWVGFIAPVKYGETLWGKASIKLFFIDSLYYLLNLVIFAVFLWFW